MRDLPRKLSVEELAELFEGPTALVEPLAAIEDPLGRADEVLFGEAPSRIVVSVAPADHARFAQIVGEWAVPLALLGRVGGDALVMTLGDGRRVAVGVDALAEAFEEGLARGLAAEAAPRGETRA